MILKIVEKCVFADHDPRTPYRVYAGLADVEFGFVEGRPVAFMTTKLGGVREIVPVPSSAYLMTDDGRTISSFSPYRQPSART